jgi:hypothetical protein
MLEFRGSLNDCRSAQSRLDKDSYFSLGADRVRQGAVRDLDACPAQPQPVPRLRLFSESSMQASIEKTKLGTDIQQGTDPTSS